jgi:hypothetical protein
MFWYKSWLETRWRFGIGLALLMVLAVGVVFDYPAVQKLMPLARNADLDAGGTLSGLIRQAAETQRDYRGYVWWQWYRQNLTQTWTVFAVLLGSGGLLSRASDGAVLFTLSLPASRNRVLATRAVTALAELLVLAVIPSLLIAIFSPAVGQRYALGDAVVHGACLFIAGATFFSLAFLLSTVFNDLWRPLLIVLATTVVLALCEQMLRGLSRYGIFRVMTGERYFGSGQVPWLGLLTSAALSLAMFYGAARNIARRDF